MGLKELEYEGVDWIHMVQNTEPVVGSCDHGNETYGFIKGGRFLD
jgi:hypothetical protein